MQGKEDPFMEKNTSRKQLPAFMVLCIISLVAAVVLAATNLITRGPIAEHQAAELQATLSTVLPADTYEAVTVPEGYSVTSLYEAKNGGETVGWSVTASAMGYGGNGAVTLGVDKNGAVTGCVVGDLNFAETAGYGARAREPEFQNQFKGLDAVAGGTFDALSGATVTSDAVRKATNNALTCVVAVGLGQTPADPVVAFSEK